MNMATKVHKIFISYHHGDSPQDGDKEYRDKLERILGNYGIAINHSVPYDAIGSDLMTETVRQKIRDEYIRDATVTVVLIGKNTWKRKHVDWEIGSTLRNTEYNPRGGLLGLILPSYDREDSTKYTYNTIPPRLHDNIQRGYALIHNWTEDPVTIQNWIHEAFDKRTTIDPDNSRKYFANNRSGYYWTD